MQEHWAQVRAEEELDRIREALQRKKQMWCIPSVAVFIAALCVFTSIMMAFFAPPNPVHLIAPGSASGSASWDVSPMSEPEPEPLPEPEPPEPQPASVDCIGSWSTCDMIHEGDDSRCS